MGSHRGGNLLGRILEFFCARGRADAEIARSSNPGESFSGTGFARAVVAPMERIGGLAGRLSLFHDPGKDRCGQCWTASRVGRVDRHLARLFG